MYNKEVPVLKPDVKKNFRRDQKEKSHFRNVTNFKMAIWYSAVNEWKENQ